MLEVADSESYCHPVERGLLERKVLTVALDGGNLFLKAFSGGFFAHYVEHALRQVGAGDPRVDVGRLGNGYAEVAGAAGCIQYLLGG